MSLSWIRLRCLGVTVLWTAVTAGLAGVLADGLGAPVGDTSDAVTRICTIALLATLAWGWAAVLAGATDAWRRVGGGEPTPDRPVGAVRRLVLASCGVALTGALGCPLAQAAPAGPPAAVVAGSPTTGRHHADAPPVRQGPPAAMVVRAGDSLWSIAAAEVQPGAGPATVTARWRAVYAANHGVIGDDPDLIHPGQQLRLPR